MEAVRYGVVDIMVALGTASSDQTSSEASSTNTHTVRQHGRKEYEHLVGSIRLHARLVHLPPHIECCKPSIRSIEAADAGKMVQISGKVVRVSPAMAFECEKLYQCSDGKNCGKVFSVKADFETYNNALVQPTVCPERYSDRKCNSNKFVEVPGGSKMTDYQEVKIQESVCGLKVGMFFQYIFELLAVIT